MKDNTTHILAEVYKNHVAAIKNENSSLPDPENPSSSLSMNNKYTKGETNKQIDVVVLGFVELMDKFEQGKMSEAEAEKFENSLYTIRENLGRYFGNDE